MNARAPIPVVGIGADGLDGLAPASRAVLVRATAIHGSPRQLALVESLGVPLQPWPSPLLPALPALAEHIASSGAVVLASGDPMFHGIGGTLARLLGPEAIRVHPAPSSTSLAAARMGWPLDRTEVLSCVTADPHTVLSVASPGGRVLVLCRDASTPVALARILADAGAGTSTVTVLAELAGPGETRTRYVAGDLATAEPTWSDLCVAAVEIAVEVADDATGACGLYASRTPGLPNDAYESDGQLTKRDVRAVTLAALAPVAGETLWDVGGGSGSIAIEWLRAAPGARAVCVERDAGRAARISANARALGVPALEVVHGTAPDVLRERHDRPDAVFIGGGLTADGMLDTCWAALRPGGRLVAAAVTLESERVLVDWHVRHGGRLSRISVETAESLGGFTGWRPARAVVHLHCVRGGDTLETTAPTPNGAPTR